MVMITSFEQWEQWAGSYTLLPYIIKAPFQSSRIASWEEAWKQSEEGAFVLESGKAGRYTFLGLHPSSSIKGKGRKAEINYNDRREPEYREGDPLMLVREWMRPYKSPNVEGAPKFIGGCAGYWGYDVVRSFERIESRITEELPIPDYYFLMIIQLWVWDQEDGQLYCVLHVPVTSGMKHDARILKEHFNEAAKTVQEMVNKWNHIAGGNGNTEGNHKVDESGGDQPRINRNRENQFSDWRAQSYQRSVELNDFQIDIETIAGLKTSLSKEEYMNAVIRIQEYIRQGDVFQVNLSVRQSRRLETPAEEIYEWLRLSNPSPYMAYMQFPELQIVSASPELLVRIEGKQVIARPIAGTRPRGSNAQEDEKLARDLLTNEKERAEHIMLVDLERNDLGKISRYGTVKVEDFMVIEYYSHVMHIVSQVEGELGEGKDAFDVIAAMFPGGTITGAPKIRTMEIIEELETVKRGPYTGSIGWIDYNGNMEFNIVIRTLLVNEDIGYIQAGAGIVIDSNPEREYEESLNKAKALWKAIQYSERGLSYDSGHRQL